MKSFPLVQIEGAPFERGRSYGRQAGDRIVRGIEIYRPQLEAQGLPIAAAAAHYLERLDRFDPELATEVRGIAAGAQQPVEAIVMLNARTELTGWDSAAARSSDECTAALAMPERTRGDVVLHGQNWDWRPDCVETGIVLHIRDGSGLEILTFCEAGQLARHGLNSAGLSLTANGLQTDNDFGPDGVPSPFTRRRMLACRSLAPAVGLLLNTPRSASHNIMLAHVDGAGRAEAINFETTPTDAYWSFPEQGLLTHANHFTHPAAVAKYRDVGLLRHPETLYRDRRVRARLEVDGNAIDLDSFKAAFADDYGAPNAVCRSPAPRADGSISATVASLVMDASAGRLWIAASPYEGAAYSEFRCGQ